MAMQLQISRVAAELKGLRVASAYRSHGSMIHFQFGALTEWYRRHGRVLFRGAYGLMIQIATWSMRQSSQTLATSASSYRKIERELSNIQGRRVVSVVIGEQQSVFQFEGRLRLALSPCHDDRGSWKLDNWVLFRGELAAVTLTEHGRLELPVAASALRAPVRV